MPVGRRARRGGPSGPPGISVSGPRGARRGRQGSEAYVRGRLHPLERRGSNDFQRNRDAGRYHGDFGRQQRERIGGTTTPYARGVPRGVVVLMVVAVSRRCGRGLVRQGLVHQAVRRWHATVRMRSIDAHADGAERRHADLKGQHGYCHRVGAPMSSAHGTNALC
jgi:hypothetical protein